MCPGGRPTHHRLIRRVARFTGLSPDDRVLDLGCGPGMLAGAFAPLVGEVIAMDPEPEMLRIAEAAFGAAGSIRFIRGSSYDLSPALGRFRLVTMGRSFQWMDRVETLRRLEAMIEPGGAVALFNSGHRDAPETGWLAAYRALVHRYAEDDSSHVKRRSGVWVGHEAILLGSAFSVLDEICGHRATPGDGRATRAAGVVAFQHDAGAARGGGGGEACGGDRGAADAVGDRWDAGSR